MAEAPGDRSQAYFDTPERAERLQLVAHLIRNAEAIPYIRGPKGAGKTRFADHLAAVLRQEFTVAQLGGATVSDVPEAVCQALGVAVDRWPAGVMDAAADGGLAVLVDDVDRLAGSALPALQDLRAQGARLVFLGSGDHAALPGDWDLQLIDLPPFSEQQLRDFLDFLGRAEAMLLKDTELGRLHRTSKGQPGALIAALASGKDAGADRLSQRGLLPWRWLAGGLAVMLVALVLWQQDRINALFAPPAEAPAQEAGVIAIPLPGHAEEAPVEAAAPIPEIMADAPPQLTLPPPAAAEVMPDAPAAVDAAQSPADESGEPALPAVEVAGEAEPVPAAETAAETGSKAGSQTIAAAAPIEPAAPAVVAAKPAKAAAVPAAQVETAKTASGLMDEAWLRSRRGKAYTLQLVGARDRAAIDSFIRMHRLGGRYAVFARDLSGAPWYSLVYGDYPDRDAALRARDRLPKALRKAWPRTFESVWQQLPAEPAEN